MTFRMTLGENLKMVVSANMFILQLIIRIKHESI